MKGIFSARLSLIVCLMLTACNNDTYADKCERMVEKFVRSPSTLKIVKLKSYKNSQPSVFIDFDAANAFGTMIRGSAYCKYESKIVAGNVIAADEPNFIEVVIDGTKLTEEELNFYNISIDMDMRDKD